MPALEEAVAAVSGLLQMRPFLVSEDDWQAVLTSHLVSPEVEQLLLDDNIDRFIERRQSDIVEQLRQFLVLKCEWGFEHTPPLEDLEIEDLDDVDITR